MGVPNRVVGLNTIIYVKQFKVTIYVYLYLQFDKHKPNQIWQFAASDLLYLYNIE